MKAVVVQQDRTVAVEDKPDPQPKPNEIVIKVKAFGQNPTDWKHAAFLSQPGDIIGCDAVGEIVSLGSEVPTGRLEKGTRVGTFTRGGKSQTHGAFAELLAVPYDLVFNIPQELSYEEAATIPIPFFTSTLSMHQLMGLDSPTPDKSLPLKPKSEWLLIWSGASAVGQYAIQLGKLAGYKVVTTASQDNWELLKSYGAQETFDYKDKDVVEKIKAATATDGGVNYAFDCVVNEQSQEAIGKILNDNGTVAVILPPQEDKFKSTQTIIQALLYANLSGKPESFGDWTPPGKPEDREEHVKWLVHATELFGKGYIKPLPIYSAGGMQDVQKGFEMMKANKVRAQKLVYTI